MAAVHHCHCQKMVKLKWEQLDHPPYSPYTSPCDFQVFGSLKTTSEREELQPGRRTQRHCEGLGLVTAPGILLTRNASAR
ncbi:hypothetical protein TNIN_315961 [Trichonephila inaurata madagascariensis]|uniref:Uncharacterized protein n=1 Tax=Trichonephila inaurata madagascariensis TaxID=2747483 RepID=A0A8X7C8B3_9ARAC|nr:hypothetical protein TNIN_315961 [Trichonephila inaurata madagascariensis]